MILPDFDHASDDMALLRRFLPLMRPEASMKTLLAKFQRAHDNLRTAETVLVQLALLIHDGAGARDLTNEDPDTRIRNAVRAVAECRYEADQATASLMAGETYRPRATTAALAVEMQARVRRNDRPLSLRPSPDAGFSGFASPAGA